MAFCMVYLLYQLQEVIFCDGKMKRINQNGNNWYRCNNSGKSSSERQIIDCANFDFIYEK